MPTTLPKRVIDRPDPAGVLTIVAMGLVVILLAVCVVRPTPIRFDSPTDDASLQYLVM